MATSSSAWSTQQLTEFLAVVSSVPEPATATREALERAAEALEAELGAVVTGDAVIASFGFPAGKAPVAELLEFTSGASEALELPGLGRCHSAVVPLEGASPAWIVLARLADDEFSREDVSLLRGMGRVLTLTLRVLRLLEDERALREETQRQADNNARLLASLEERRGLLEQLSKIQRSISHRTRLQDVLDAIAEGGAELLGTNVAALRLVDANDPSQTVTVSSRGVRPEALRLARRAPVGHGVGGRAIVEGRAVLVEDHSSAPDPMPDLVAEGVRTALAVPVHEHGTVVGSLTVGSSDPSPGFGESEQEVLVTYAEHASLALAAAKSVDTMRQAFNDSLTGLANRALFLDRLDHALSRAERDGSGVTVLFLDLDGFKLVNDSLGHAAGDALLVAGADRIRRVVRGGETAARLGGDEFAVLLEGTRSGAEAVHVAQRLREALKPPFTIADREVLVSASIGIASGGGSADELLRNADVAMYRAKRSGKGRYQVFEPGMHAEVVARLELEADIQRAVEREEFVVHYQPIVDLAERRIVAVEALVRWRHPERGLVAPGAFMGVAEETGLIVPIGAYVLREACRQVANWHAELPSQPPLKVSVNLSARQLAQPDIADEVRRALADSRLVPGSLILELTETVIMQDTEASIAQLRALKELGLQIAVDDFGTGYSSLRYLQRFPIDILKIAKPFVDGLTERSDEAVLARAIADLGRNLGMRTIGEGIEVEEQARRLSELGCPLGQGFLFGRPLPGDAMTVALMGDDAVARIKLPEGELGPLAVARSIA